MTLRRFLLRFGFLWMIGLMAVVLSAAFGLPGAASALLIGLVMGGLLGLWETR